MECSFWEIANRAGSLADFRLRVFPISHVEGREDWIPWVVETAHLHLVESMDWLIDRLIAWLIDRLMDGWID